MIFWFGYFEVFSNDSRRLEQLRVCLFFLFVCLSVCLFVCLFVCFVSQTQLGKTGDGEMVEKIKQQQ